MFLLHHQLTPITTLAFIGSIFLFLAAIFLVIFYLKTRITCVLLFIAVAEWLLWCFAFSMVLIYSLDSTVSKSTIMTIYLVALTSSRAALLIWFIIFQLLQSSRQQMLHLFFHGILAVLLGVSVGYGWQTVNFSRSGDHWVIIYDPIGALLLVITYGLFVIYQMVLYYIRIAEKEVLKRKFQFSRDFMEKCLALGYFISFFLAIFAFLFARSESTALVSTTWIFFGGLSQLLLALSIIAYPRSMIFGHVVLYEMGVYSASDGLTIFHVTPKPDVVHQEDLLTVALKGMEQVVSSLIGAKKPMTTMGFGDRAIILFKIDNHYFYAIVNEPNYIARDITAGLALKWKSIYHSLDDKTPHLLAEWEEVQEFIVSLENLVRHYLS